MLAACVIGKKIYALGGPWPGSTGIKTLEVYDPSSDSWTTKASLPTGRWALSAVSADGKMYAIAGHTGSDASAMVNVYDPGQDSWSQAESISKGRWGLSSCIVNGRIYAIGGSEIKAPPHPAVATVEEYNLTEVTGLQDDTDYQGKRADFHLYQNYPNPFNPSTSISFYIPASQFIEITVYDVLGHKVEILISEKVSAGRHSYRWQADNYNSGVYFYKIRAGQEIKVNKMILSR